LLQLAYRSACFLQSVSYLNATAVTWCNTVTTACTCCKRIVHPCVASDVVVLRAFYDAAGLFLFFMLVLPTA